MRKIAKRPLWREIEIRLFRYWEDTRPKPRDGFPSSSPNPRRSRSRKVASGKSGENEKAYDYENDPDVRPTGFARMKTNEFLQEEAEGAEKGR